MASIKPESPPPSPAGDGEEAEIYDLYTLDTVETKGLITASTNNRKRSGIASGVSPASKRPCNPTSRNRKSQPKAQSKAKAKAKAPSKAAILVMSIDFGTTHSGAGYAHTGNERLGPMALTRWDETNTDYVKIPSAIIFGPDGDIWGVDAKHLPDALRWFKLLLLKESDLDEEIRTSAQLQEARVKLQVSGKSAVEVISIFLKRMFQHAVEKLKLARGAEMVDTSRFHIVLTVPAIWPEYARRRMQQAVNHAGILKTRPIGPTTFEFVSEPEAAALATLSTLDGQPNIKAGDTIVIVDCGGGTVDLITYKIIKKNPMTVQEFVTGKGALCGAIFVEERFRELVIKKLKGISDDAMERVSGEEMQEIMTRDWEEKIRNQFNGAARTWTIRYPFSLIDRDRLDPNKGYPTFTITSEEVEEVFRPSMEKIESLVNCQIGAAVKKNGNLPKYVILVGGFGNSRYLLEYLKLRLQGVEVLQCGGSEPWSSIIRGAVIHGMSRKNFGSPLKVAVKSRIARESLGVVCEEPWNPDLHHPDDKWFDNILQKWVGRRVMKWHVSRGSEVPETVSIKFVKYLDELPDKIVTIIYKSAADEPSARKDDSVMMAAEITWDIQVDWESLEIFVNNQQKTFRKLEYTVQMKCSAGATAFSIHHGGYRQASKNVALEFHESADD